MKKSRVTFSILLMIAFIAGNIGMLLFTLASFSPNLPAADQSHSFMNLVLLIPYLIQFASIPFILGEIVCLIIFKGKLMISNIIFFGLYILQVILFNIFINI